MCAVRSKFDYLTHTTEILFYEKTGLSNIKEIQLIN